MGPHGARADVADHANPYQVVQCSHGLFGRNGRVESMDLEDVDVAGVEAVE